MHVHCRVQSILQFLKRWACVCFSTMTYHGSYFQTLTGSPKEDRGEKVNTTWLDGEQKLIMT